MDSITNQERRRKPRITKKIAIAGGILLILGLLLCAGAVSVFAYNLGTDSEGYVYSNVYHVNTSAYAFALYMNEYKLSAWGFLGAANVAQMKFIARPTNSKDLFVGIATTSASQAYRQNFECEIPTWWHWWAEPYYAEIFINTTAIDGTGAPQLPQDQTFWLASAHSNSTATMTYLPLHEQHIWFVMNFDDSQNVSADIQLAFRSPILTSLPYILGSLGIILLVGGVYVFRRKKGKDIGH